MSIGGGAGGEGVPVFGLHRVDSIVVRVTTVQAFACLMAKSHALDIQCRITSIMLRALLFVFNDLRTLNVNNDLRIGALHYMLWCCLIERYVDHRALWHDEHWT